MLFAIFEQTVKSEDSRGYKVMRLQKIEILHRSAIQINIA